MKLGIVRPILLAVAFATGAVTLTSCSKPAAEVAAEPEPATSPAPLGAPPPATPIAVATPPPDPLAPPGVFYLLQKTSITTEAGIIGLKPGQGLRQVSPGTYEVDGHTVQLRDHQVTNNLRIARQIAAAEASAQAALRLAARATPVIVPTTAKAAEATAVSLPATPAPRIEPRPREVTITGLSGGSRLGTGTGAADPETANRRNVKVDSSGRHYWRDSRGAIRYDF